MMRRGFGFFWALVTITIASVAGWFAYNAGLSANIANSGHGAVVVANAPEFPVFWVVLLILFIAFSFRRRRWQGGGHRRWDGEVPPVIEEKMKSWHDKVHGNAPAEPAAGQGNQPQAQG